MLFPVCKELCTELIEFRSVERPLAIVLALDIDHCDVATHGKALQTSVDVVAEAPVVFMRFVSIDECLVEDHEASVNGYKVWSVAWAVKHRIFSALAVTLNDSTDCDDVALRLPPLGTVE